jgi:hypothetical protein
MSNIVLQSTQCSEFCAPNRCLRSFLHSICNFVQRQGLVAGDGYFPSCRRRVFPELQETGISRAAGDGYFPSCRRRVFPELQETGISRAAGDGYFPSCRRRVFPKLQETGSLLEVHKKDIEKTILRPVQALRFLIREDRTIS